MAYEDVVLADSPAVYYRLGEAVGTSPQDSSGNGLNGTLTTIDGTGPTINQPGLLIADPNTCVLFPRDTNTGYVERADNALLDTGDTFTLEAWVTKLNNGNTITIFDKGTGCYHLDIHTDNTVRAVKANIAVIAVSTATTTTATTYHIVWTKNGTTNVLYLDGVDVTGAVTDATIVNTNDRLFIGAGNPGGAPNNVYDGKIDEAAIYPTALSAARVAAHFQAGQGIFPPGPSTSQKRSRLILDTGRTIVLRGR